jgi:hypothetical protein
MNGLDGCVRNRRGNLGISARAYMRTADPAGCDLCHWNRPLSNGRDHVFVMAFIAAPILLYHAYLHVQR